MTNPDPTPRTSKVIPFQKKTRARLVGDRLLKLREACRWVLLPCMDIHSQFITTVAVCYKFQLSQV